MTDADMEAEANLFAICLLMPEDWIKRDWETYKTQPKPIRAMAKRYEVSIEMMTARLVQLHLPIPIG